MSTPATTTPTTFITDLLDGERVVEHDGSLEVNLEGYGFRWFRMSADSQD